MFDIITVLEEQTSLLSIPEVARIFRVSPRTVERHVKERKIPSLLLFGSRKFDPAQLARWVIKRNPKLLEGRQRPVPK